MIAVGDSTRLEIVFSTSTYHSKVTKRPRISSNGSEIDQHVVITTEVVAFPDSLRPMVIEPYKIDLSSTVNNPLWQSEFSLINCGDQTLHPTLIASEPEFFAVTLPDSIVAGDTATAKVTLTGAAVQAAFHKSITIELDDAGRHRYTFPIQRSVIAGP